ncbi:MAG: methylmalonyl Co-A mutase-associated GTPase MeaB, partial [Actinomycetota bacterium]|nr:methylmalonyl Co-A mutase-associated GTPase MeaB [Actinomycetota bacterium]
QTAKAGLLEIGHVYCVNKADQGDAAATASRLTQMVEMGSKQGWRPPVVVTSALHGEGIGQLWEAIDRHHEATSPPGRLGRVDRDQAVETAPDSSA